MNMHGALSLRITIQKIVYGRVHKNVNRKYHCQQVSIQHCIMAYIWLILVLAAIKFICTLTEFSNIKFSYNIELTVHHHKYKRRKK